jgi:phage shock protein B
MSEEVLIISMMALGIPLVVVIGIFILIAISMLRGGSRKEDKKMRSDEAQLMQEIHRGLTRMEERVDALETLLLDRAGFRKPGKGAER